MTTVRDRIDLLRKGLVHLVHHFNQRMEWDAALRAQRALVAIDDIFGSDETDFEEEIDP
jgi:hypothetical protein